MGEYVQSCVCRGRVLSAAHDIERYSAKLTHARQERAAMALRAQNLRSFIQMGVSGSQSRADQSAEAVDCDGEAVLWDQEIHRFERRIGHARLQILAGEEPCQICGGRGTMSGNGSAQIGGSGRANDTDMGGLR